MDEGIAYTDQEDLDDDLAIDSSEWQMEHVSFMEKEESKMLLQYQNYHLHFIRKKGPQTYRRMIPSTKLERLAFYRNYVSSPNKAMRKYYDVHGFMWYYLINVFFKTLPHTFVNVFLASYVPEQHSYIVHMSPCFYGAKYIFIASALFDLINFSENMVLLLDYLLRGIIYKNPWNRCSLKLPGTEKVNYTCYTATDMVKRTLNQNVTTELIGGITFNVIDGERFLLVQVEYFIKRFFHMLDLTDRFFFFVIWIMVALMAHNIFKRNFWKLLNISQALVLLMFAMTYIHTTLSYVRNYEEMKHNNVTVTEYAPAVMYNDIDALLDVTVAPPIIHILTARSVQEILPNRDSALIVASNTLFYMIRGLLTYRLQRHCELLTNSPLTTQYNYLCWYFLWPIYLNSFYLGDIFTLIYFILNFIVEFATFMVAFQCLVEFMSVEWMHFNRLFLTVTTTVTGIVLYAALPMDMDSLCIVFKLSVNIIECIVINFMYPLPRLIDDITFHYGIQPSKMRVFTMRLVVVAACIIFYVCLYCLVEDYITRGEDFVEEYFVLCMLPAILFIGFIYIAIKRVVRKKMAFHTLFVPEETWGPNDYNLRQLRKQFDSRFYIGCQAPRELSRYLITKGESKCYHLDLRYDSDRRSTIATTDYRKENEMKAL